jgi:co-chaperonin GroES (HSP10)
MQLLGDRIIVKKIEKKSKTGLILLDEEKQRERFGEVLETGNKCVDLHPGDSVIYSGGMNCDDIPEVSNKHGKGCILTNESKVEWFRKENKQP